MDELISVIVPVYNVERYLTKCIESITSQSYRQLEIILVDDGSKDSSGKMCDSFSHSDTRIKVIHKDNQGLGMARNTGIDHATGEFIAFIDSDDYIEPEAFSKLIDYISKYDGDVYYFGHYIVSNSTKRENGAIPSRLHYVGQECQRDFFLNALGKEPPEKGSNFAGISAWCALYRRKFIVNQNIKFLSERKILCEDIFFNLDVSGRAQNIYIVPEYLYDYVHREYSLTNAYRADRFNVAIVMHENLQEKLNYYSVVSNKDQRVIRYLLINLIVCLKQEVAYEKKQGKSVTLKKIRNICENKIVISALKDYKVNKLPLSQIILFTSMKRKKTKVVYWLTKTKQRLDKG